MANGKGNGFGRGSRSVSRISGGTAGGNLPSNGRKGRKWNSGNGTADGLGGGSQRDKRWF